MKYQCSHGTYYYEFCSECFIEYENKRTISNEEWISKNKQEYIGQWVALNEGVLLAAGMNGVQVYNEASKLCKVPFVVKITKDDLPFGGW